MQMKTNKVSGTLFYVAAVLFYLAAIINFAGSDRSSGVIWLALGSAFLCLGSMYARKAKKSKNDEEKK